MSDTLQTILACAERRHTEQQGNAEFLLVLLQQTAIELSVGRLVVWIVGTQTSRMIAETGDSPHQDPSSDELQSLTNGNVRVLKQGEDAHSNAGRHLLAASAVAGDCRLIIEIVETQRIIDHELLIQLADVFADLQRRHMLESFLVSSQNDSTWQSLITQLHCSLDANVISNTIATDAAVLLPCRRIAVGQRRGRHWDVIATSGVSQPNQRSDASRHISRWIESAAAGIANSDEDPQRRIRPLGRTTEWSDADWAVVLECDDGFGDQKRLDWFLKHASLALANSAAAKRGSPLNFLRRMLQHFTQLGSLATTFAVIALATMLLFVQTELRVEAYGELNPTERAFVFAPEDGTVTELHVQEGSEASAQEVLCVLTNEDLNVQLETIDGSLAGANARLAAIDALRSGRRIETVEARLLSAEQAELEAKVASLAKQSAMVTKRLHELHVTARIPGRVYGDRLRQVLFRRPVQRGQYLFEVANPAGGWQLHLRIAEPDVRHVLAARRDAQEKPKITFSLETSPEINREASLDSVGLATEVDSGGKLSTLAIADLNDAGFDNERPGSGVVARIHCGRRSVGFVWFRQFIEFVQRHTWL